MNKNYTKERWDEEIKSLGIIIPLLGGYIIYGNRLSCPNCGVVGFYSPREVPTYKYRMCKFCGFWQKVDEDPKPCNAFYHICNNPESLPQEVANYDSCWNNGDQCTCPRCNVLISKKTKWAKENDLHPFNTYKNIIQILIENKLI